MVGAVIALETSDVTDFVDVIASIVSAVVVLLVARADAVVKNQPVAIHPDILVHTVYIGCFKINAQDFIYAGR